MSALRRHRELERIWASRPGWRGKLTTVNNNDIGLMFLFAAGLFFVIGGILAMMIRAQLASPRSMFMGPELYNQVFTMHGTIMMFLFAIPLIEGLTIYLLPKLLGTRDLAFPRLSAFGLWCYIFGGSMLIVALLAGVAPDSGWFMYPPLSATLGSPGINSDFWLIGITFVEISALSAAVEIIVTVLMYRAPGMSLDKLPIFAWYMLVVAVMILTGFPPLILGSILLELERAFGMPFFQVAQGGDSLLWQHLFWLFGHPEVYIIFLPAAGVVSMVLPVMARTTLLGYTWVVMAVVALAILSFGLWVHHMFTTGIPHMGLAFFSAASTLVAVPTGMQIFAWIGTLWQGRPEMHLPMRWLVAFFATFVIGGLTGVMVAVVPFDWQAHDTYFVVAHLHYVLVGGFVFPALAGLYYWLPHFTGRKRHFKMGEIAFWLIVLGFHGTFLLLHWAGLLGMRRRIASIESGSGWELINLLASIGGFVMAIGFALVLIDVGVNAAVATRGRRNPWRAPTLEWAIPAPSPSYNLASIPQIGSRHPLYDDPELPARIARGEGYLGTPRGGRRETLMVDIASGRPSGLVIFPTNTALPIVMALVAGGLFVGMLIKAYWLVPLSLLGVAALAAWWAWTLGSREDHGAQSVGRDLALPSADEMDRPPGWWGSLFLLLADGVFYGALLFGYAFLWTVAPNWPPPAWLEPGLAGPLLMGVGTVLAATGSQRVVRALRRDRSVWPGLLANFAGLAALAGAAVTVLAGTDPAVHAYDATLWVIAGYIVFHTSVTGLMTVFVALRAAAGYLSARRIGETNVLRLWSNFSVATAVLGLAVAWLPRMLS